MKMYDLVAGKQLLAPSRMFSRRKTLELFPTINRDRPLVGSILYYDGQQNDARTNLELALTSAQHGATIANYVKVIEILKETSNNGSTKIVGVMCENVITGEKFKVKAKCVINATGPHTDHVRRMSDEECQNICVPSRGTHITLDRALAPEGNLGVLQPNTSDGRVVFVLPWQNGVVAGTTDIPDDPSSDLKPTGN